METDVFADRVLSKRPYAIDSEGIKSVLEGASFISQERLPKGNIRSGDVFKKNAKNYFLNIRPDCDCIPRGNKPLDNIELYCLEGRVMESKRIKEFIR